MTRSASPPPPFDLVVPEGAGSLSDRLGDAIMREIRAGRLAVGDSLPSTRTLAATTGIARSTIVTAYENLAAQGILLTQPGSRTVVGRAVATSADRVDRSATESATDVEVSMPARRPTYDLMPGYPDAELINARAWSRDGVKPSEQPANPGPAISNSRVSNDEICRPRSESS